MAEAASNRSVFLQGVYCRKRTLVYHIVLATGSLIGLSASANINQTNILDWGEQFGVAGYDFGTTVVADSSGNAYVSGRTQGSLFGPAAGLDDAFIAKYDPAGNQVWAKQVGTAGSERGNSIALDSSGNIYITGYTTGAFGGPNAGNRDTFVAKYDPSGNFVWSNQIGTTDIDRAYDIAVDKSGNAYLTGVTYGSLGGSHQGAGDAYLSKFDASGNLSWTKQFGTTGGDQGFSVAVDSAGNAFVAGYTTASLFDTNAGSFDAFVVKYTHAGDIAWSRQVGSSGSDSGFHVAVDGDGNAFLSGTTSGLLGAASAGGDDAFVVKFDALGNPVWTRQFGSSEDDAAPAVEPSPDGTVFVAGRTNGDLAGTSAGGIDAFLVRLASDGEIIWAQQTGTAATDAFSSITLAGPGTVYATGGSDGDLSGTKVGDGDAILHRYIVPEPGSLVMLGLGGVGLLRRRRG